MYKSMSQQHLSSECDVIIHVPGLPRLGVITKKKCTLSLHGDWYTNDIPGYHCALGDSFFTRYVMGMKRHWNRFYIIRDWSGVRFNISWKAIISGIGIPINKFKRSWDRLLSWEFPFNTQRAQDSAQSSLKSVTHSRQMWNNLVSYSVCPTSVIP